MSSELVVNARNLSGLGPLWMLYETALRQPADRVCLIVSDEATAKEAIAALLGLGLPANLDPIGGEFHVLCRGCQEAGPLLLYWLQAKGAGDAQGNGKNPGSS